MTPTRQQYDKYTEELHARSNRYTRRAHAAWYYWPELPENFDTLFPLP